jgi:hypothetical protein
MCRNIRRSMLIGVGRRACLHFDGHHVPLASNHAGRDPATQRHHRVVQPRIRKLIAGKHIVAVVTKLISRSRTT